MAEIRFEGVEELEKALAENIKLNDVKRVVRTNGSQLHEKAQQNADFRGHYAWEKGKGKVFKTPTGHLKGLIEKEIKDNGLTADITAKAEYSGYVEKGTRFMDAQPYMEPAFNEQSVKFKNDMKKLVR